MLRGDRIGGALNARRMALGRAETLTPARRCSGRTPASPSWRLPLPIGRFDQTFAVVLAALRGPPSSRAADPSGTRQMAGRAGRKNTQGCRVNDEAGRQASCWQNRLYAPCADRGRSVTVRSAPAFSAPGLKAGDASRRSKTATSRCGMMRPDWGRRRLKASDRLTRGVDQVTKERSVWRL
jgi:hypothetical protein